MSERASAILHMFTAMATVRARRCLFLPDSGKRPGISVLAKDRRFSHFQDDAMGTVKAVSRTLVPRDTASVRRRHRDRVESRAVDFRRGKLERLAELVRSSTASARNDGGR
jgi:hypothetical protein